MRSFASPSVVLVIALFLSARYVPDITAAIDIHGEDASAHQHPDGAEGAHHHGDGDDHHEEGDDNDCHHHSHCCCQHAPTITMDSAALTEDSTHGHCHRVPLESTPSHVIVARILHVPLA